MNKRRFAKAVKRLTRLPGGKYFFLYAGNKLRHFYLKAIRSTRVAHPSTIMIELTNHCNLHCTTCPREYDYGKEMDLGRMEVEQAKGIIDECWPYLDSIGLTGMGETFLFREIGELVDYIREKNRGIIISVSTNAVVPGFLDKVVRLVGKIDTIQISIDGLDEVYDRIRVGSDFRLLDENIRKLRDLSRNSGTDLMLNMVVTKENYHHMPALVEYAAKRGIAYMDFTLFNLASVTKIERDYYRFYQTDEFLDAVGELDKAIRRYPSVTVTNRNFKTDNSFRKCPFPWTHFYICWNGFVTPCCAKPFPKEKHFGNVFDAGVMPVLNSDSFREFRQMWFNNETPDFCDKCHFIDIEPIETAASTH